MPETIARASHATDSVVADIDRVCMLVPPLWELDRFVAVNPFLGFSAVPVEQAARAVNDGLDAQLLPSMAHFRRLWRGGGLGNEELDAVAAACQVSRAHLEAILDGTACAPMRQPDRVLTCAESLDRRTGSRWEACTRESAAAWCGWHAARRGGDDLFEGWLEDASLDRALEIEGLRGLRAWIGQLPRTPVAAIGAMLDRLGIPAWDRQPYLYRLLGGVHGWASHMRRLAWVHDRQDPGLLRDLLAIRICLDAAVMALAPVSLRHGNTRSAPDPVEDERLRLALQDAVESARARRLVGRFLAPPSQARPRPVLQAAFCIDVRSEPLRRHLERCDAAIETIGFAGFFGMAMRWHGDHGPQDRCPVLVRPSLHLHDPAGNGVRDRGSLVASLLGAPGGMFPAVETLGLAALARLVRRAFLPRRAGRRRDEAVPLDGLLEAASTPETRVDAAASILAGMSLRGRVARLVVLCGHQGRSENNPHAAGLDCGACGGQGGAINARLAANLLNDPGVRRGLHACGVEVPEDTHFIAAVHDTGVDQVRWLDAGLVPHTHAHDLERAAAWLEQASRAVRRERARSLGLDPNMTRLEARLADRCGDWSQVRPEWALARNMAFVAARRARTARRDLEGRAFLHDYDPDLDQDGSVLEQILAAPMVVASWINLQYFASTVDNRAFGSGDKMLQNRVGSLGVTLGNGHDLRSGLPLQSVRGPDGRSFHEPLRLQVFVEAPTARIDRVLQLQPDVRDLVENGWVKLFALSPSGRGVARRVPGVGWEPFEGDADRTSLSDDPSPMTV